ncbi:MAG TPA: hypothetical protein VJ813_00185 [Vicinamibacterales bacterium]|nr:hypothetical protein [Vicinamibacterales bacterium]
MVTAVMSAACRPDQTAATAVEAKAGATERTAADPDRALRLREDALTSAKVWQPPAVPISEVNLRVNPPGAGPFGENDEVWCQFKLRTAGGTTPKFYCEIPTVGEVKVKYGSNPELHAEVAASRLLSALGFGADRMSVVRRVRCAGCPSFPFQSLRCYDRVGRRSACFPGGIDYDAVVDFDVAVIERKLEGRVIEAVEDQGWAWYELDRIDPARGGATRAEVDGLRLMAVFLAHWDNKSTNQRLICRPGGEQADGGCTQPLAILQDLGATFGPTKIDLHNWRQGRIWKDGATCTVSMEHLPWGGGTFPEGRISDAGRRFLLGLLEQLSDRQLADLFDGSRVTWHDQFSAEARRADAWVRVFKDKVRQIRDGGPCPS